MSNRHDKFIKYWKDNGKFPCEYLTSGSNHWKDLSSERSPGLLGAHKYRMKEDPHWKLRKKWIESDFTLKIESKLKDAGFWLVCDKPMFLRNHEYREKLNKEVVPEKVSLESLEIVATGTEIKEELNKKQSRYKSKSGMDWIDECADSFTVEEFRGAMKFTIGKYNKRIGKKDAVIQEIRKMKDYCTRWEEYEQQLEDERKGISAP